MSANKAPSAPPESWAPLVRVARATVRPFERFLHIQAASGIVLLTAAAAALALANSPWAQAYADLWHTPLGIRVGTFTFERSLEWFVNDVLMVIFFFVVGMEIHREIDHGELSDVRRAALPVAAALGGMLLPAALYLLIAGAPDTRSGWGVPMATDIAFAVGILALLGKRVPDALRVLLLALAVIDDLGAIVIIALFYSSGIEGSGLAVATLGVVAIFVLQRLGVRQRPAYVVPAFVTWAGIYSAGIHPTVAGVIVGLVTPVRAWFGAQGFVDGIRRELDHLDVAAPDGPSEEQLGRTLRQVNLARREAVSPSQSLIETLHPWVAFGIMPVFALANAGVALEGGAFDGAAVAVASAVAAGLVLGKPFGILAFCWMALKLRVAALPDGVGFAHLTVVGVIAGIGFTMSLFIANLAFPDDQLLAAAKIGVLVASAAAAVLGLGLGWMLLPRPTEQGER